MTFRPEVPSDGTVYLKLYIRDLATVVTAGPAGRRGGQGQRGDPRREQVFQADAPEHFRADPIRDAVDDLAAVLRRVDVYSGVKASAGPNDM
jgi:hypothetical protein